MNVNIQNLGKVLHRISKFKTSNLIFNRPFAIFSKKCVTSQPCFFNNAVTGNENNDLQTEFLKNFIVSSSQIRLKSYNRSRKTGSKSSEYDSGSESESDEDIPQELESGSKVVQIQTDSLRCDLILKNGLAISRNKLEMYFYEGRIRINGKKIMKKSTNVDLRDEVDVIKKFDEENPDLLHVGRVEVLKAKPYGDFVHLTVRKFKNLLIQNYETDPWEEKQPEGKENDDDDSETKNDKTKTNPNRSA